MVNVIQALNLPKASLKIERKQKQLFVWCIVRRKKLLLTPEEWVRQHLIHYLIFSVGVPIERIISEYPMVVNGLSRRCDLLVVDTYGRPKMIVECKSTQVKIDEKVAFQIAHYNRHLQVEYLMLSNGLEHFIWQIDSDAERFITLNELQAAWFL